ncbi:hypothetical protein BDN67DRAFT_173960 [Paxillus ammoniavirescens]|nr:hypothetical protein BDN67DRAFT_173960 [Paxillus ammoniavirescens]
MFALLDTSMHVFLSLILVPISATHRRWFFFVRHVCSRHAFLVNIMTHPLLTRNLDITRIHMCDPGVIFAFPVIGARVVPMLVLGRIASAPRRGRNFQ